MRKTLLSCVVASAMALACTATSFAAVTYGEDNQLNVAYTAEGNKLAVTAGWNADDAQVTLLVVKGDNPSTIADGDILYIDQQAKADAAKAFASVGLLGETALAEGTYTVKAGGTAGNVYTSTFTIAADAPAGVKVVWGDVNFDNAADTQDANAIFAYALNGPAVVGGEANANSYAINAAIGTTAAVLGDVNCDGGADTQDANAIFAYALNGPAVVGGEANVNGYAINAEVTVK